LAALTLLAGAVFLLGGRAGFLGPFREETARALAAELLEYFEDFAMVAVVRRRKRGLARPRWLAEVGTKEQWTPEQ
jgi:hypothetical protein